MSVLCRSACQMAFKEAIQTTKIVIFCYFYHKRGTIYAIIPPFRYLRSLFDYSIFFQ